MRSNRILRYIKILQMQSPTESVIASHHQDQQIKTWCKERIAWQNHNMPEVTYKPPGPGLVRRIWSKLDRIRTPSDRCAYFQHKWGKQALLQSDFEDYQTIDHYDEESPTKFYESIHFTNRLDVCLQPFVLYKRIYCFFFMRRVICNS